MQAHHAVQSIMACFYFNHIPIDYVYEEKNCLFVLRLDWLRTFVFFIAAFCKGAIQYGAIC